MTFEEVNKFRLECHIFNIIITMGKITDPLHGENS